MDSSRSRKILVLFFGYIRSSCGRERASEFFAFCRVGKNGPPVLGALAIVLDNGVKEVELVAPRRVAPRSAAQRIARDFGPSSAHSEPPAERGRVVAARQLPPTRSAGLQTSALVTEAKKLARKKMRTKEISNHLRFKHGSHFCRRFHELFSTVPRALRQAAI